MYSENERRKFYVREIDEARALIIGKHRKCKGRGFVEIIKRDPILGLATKQMEVCSCRKKFDAISRYILSNIPYRSLINQQIYPKLVTDELSDTSLELRKEIIFPYVRNIKKAIKNPFGFLLLGKNGTGKTFIGLKVLYYALIKGYTAHNIELSDFLHMTRRTFDKGSEMEALIKEISFVDMLLIDEIGNESKRSEFVISEFKSLFKRRVNNGKPTILISNYSYKDFCTVYGKSVCSMIEAHCRIFDFARAVDVRKGKCSSEMDSFFRKIKKR